MVRMLCRAAVAVLMLLGQPSWAEDVRITADIAAKQIVVNGQIRRFNVCIYFFARIIG